MAPTGAAVDVPDVQLMIGSKSSATEQATATVLRMTWRAASTTRTSPHGAVNAYALSPDAWVPAGTVHALDEVIAATPCGVPRRELYDFPAVAWPIDHCDIDVCPTCLNAATIRNPESELC
jgi:hypothetical protein